MSRRELYQGALFGIVGGVFGNMWMASFFAWVDGILDDATMTNASGALALLFLIGFVFVVVVLWNAGHRRDL